MSGRLGVEVELLAPEGSSRLVLAVAIAAHLGGRVERYLFPDAEPSKLEGTALFHNLTPGFRIFDASGAVRAWVVDDITLQQDLPQDADPVDGWWRVVSDDRRLIDLAARHVDASLPLPAALEPLATLFSSSPEPGPGGMWRVRTLDGLPLVIGAPLPGGRHRGAELVTAPIAEDHERHLDELLAIAVAHGFTAPTEGATHVHLDAAPLRESRTFRRFVQVVHRILPELRALLGVNPACVRLGPWPDALVEQVEATDWDDLSWPDARRRLEPVRLTKYCDVNVRNVVLGSPDKDTVELRILPVLLEAEPIVRAARLLEAIIRWSASDLSDDPHADLDAVLAAVPLDEADRAAWSAARSGSFSSPSRPDGGPG